jgi:hypothetical protein
MTASPPPFSTIGLIASDRVDIEDQRRFATLSLASG